MGKINYLPAGATAVVFAVLSQFHAVIPHVFKYRLAISPLTGDSSQSLTFSDKSYTYLLALQLSLSQFPGSLLQACIGWTVGYVWRNDLLPASISAWRVPGWMVGAQRTSKREEFDGLRRRLGEGVDASSTGANRLAEAQGGRRRTLAGRVIDQFRGTP